MSAAAAEPRQVQARPVLPAVVRETVTHRL